MTRATIGRWGKNLAVRFPGDVAKAARLTEGERIEIEAHDGEIVLRRVVPQPSLEELFRDRTPAEWRAAYAGAYHWGPDVGREIVED